MGEKKRETARQSALWARAVGWGFRHPVMSSIPVGLTGLGVHAYNDPVQAAAGVAAAAVATGAWYQGHPASWDTWIQPRIRAFRRRWLSRAYLGPFWQCITEESKLTTENRSTGLIRYPRVLKVTSHSPSTETVKVRMLVGQTLKQWQEAAEALAVGLNAVRVGIERISPQKIALIVQRKEPFSGEIVPPDIVDDVEAVDLKDIYLGETEFGTEWREPLKGQHVLIAGESGSGKNSVTWAYLRSIAPLIRDGLVRLWVGNPKETEMAAVQPISYRYAVTATEVADMINEFWSNIEGRKKKLAEQGLRTFTPSRETPLDLLLLDELGAITGYADTTVKRAISTTFPLILSQARSLGGTVVSALQEPDKGTVPQRDLFTLRIQMRAANSNHPDMTLGEEMRQRGALADEIPNVPETAGIGFVVRQRTRTPIRVRATYCNDDDIKETIEFVKTWHLTQPNTTPKTPAAITDDDDIDADGWYDEDDDEGDNHNG